MQQKQHSTYRNPRTVRLHLVVCSIHYTEQEKLFLSEATKHGLGTASAISEMETFNYLTVNTILKSSQDLRRKVLFRDKKITSALKHQGNLSS